MLGGPPRCSFPAPRVCAQPPLPKGEQPVLQPEPAVSLQQELNAHLVTIERKLDQLARSVDDGFSCWQRAHKAVPELGLAAQRPGTSQSVLAAQRPGTSQSILRVAARASPQLPLHGAPLASPPDSAWGSPLSARSTVSHVEYPALPGGIEDELCEVGAPADFETQLRGHSLDGQTIPWPKEGMGRERRNSLASSEDLAFMAKEYSMLQWELPEKSGLQSALTRQLKSRRWIAEGVDAHALMLEEAQERCLWRFVHGSCFQIVCSTAIVLNAALIGLLSDIRLKALVEGRDESSAWEQVDVGFAAFFAVELLLRLLSERSLFIYGAEWKWNLFDSVLVALSTADAVLSGISSGDLSNVTIVRILRFARFIRIVRIARAVRAFHSLRLVVFAIFESMVSLLWCFLVVGLIIYVFAVFFLSGVTEHFRTRRPGGEPPDEQLLEFYGSVLRAVASLFMTISGGVDWYDVVTPLKAIHWVYEPIFNAYVFFMVIGVMNVVVGAFVAATADIASKDRDHLVKAELTQVQTYTNKIRTFFQEADQDKSGMLSWEEFKAHLKKPSVMAYFHALELDVSQAHVLFELLDRDGNDEVSLDEFLAGCMRLKGQAKSLDVNMLLYENRRLFKKLTDFIRMASERAEGGDGLACSGTLTSLGDTFPPGRAGRRRSLSAPGPLQRNASMASLGDRGLSGRHVGWR